MTVTTRHAPKLGASMLPEDEEIAVPVEDADDGPLAGDETGAEPEGDETGCEATEIEGGDVRPPGGRWTVPRLMFVAGLLIVIVLAALAGWLGVKAHQSHQNAQLKAQYVQVGSQGALNLTTIDYEHADADVQRILQSASGEFYDDFAKRSQPFVDVVKQTKSKSVGTITEAGLESVTGDQAQVLVAVNVTTSLGGAPEQEPRSWRMRMSVQKQGDDMKVSNVEFVP